MTAATTTMAAVLAGALVAFSSPALAQAPDAVVTVRTSPEYGQYLADSQGRALYAYEADVRGTDGREAATNCLPDPGTHPQSCVEVWPPFKAEEPWPADVARADLLATLRRPDGALQVTYNGWPLYYYVRDTEPGQTEGQQVVSFDGAWFLLNPRGEPIAD